MPPSGRRPTPRHSPSSTADPSSWPRWPPVAAPERRLYRKAGLDFLVICKLCHELREAQRHAYLLSRHRAAAKLALFLQMLEAHGGTPGGLAAEVLLPMREMAEARLVLTDALIAESLRRGKAAERAARGEEHENNQFQPAPAQKRRLAQHEGE